MSARALVDVEVQESGYHVRAIKSYNYDPGFYVPGYDWAMDYCRRTLTGWARFRFEFGMMWEFSRLVNPRTQGELALSMSVCKAWCDAVNERREDLERTAIAMREAMQA